MIESLKSGLLFVFIITVVVIAAFFWKVKEPKEWWNNEGKGAVASALKGILVILIIGFALSVSLGLIFPKSAKAESVFDTKYGYFFNRAYVYAGIDHTFKQSAQCQAGYQDDRLTSNMGFGLNLYQNLKRDVELDLIYHHQSCVLGRDRNSYDAIGIRGTWYFYTR